jgi:peptidyl-prolyl cis-trans isomerase C
VLALTLLSCSPNSPGGYAGASSPRALPAGVVGVVGGAAITEERVVEVAQAQGIPVSEAAGREVRDALLASGALARGYEDAPLVRAAVRGRLSRAALLELYAAIGRDEPTDAEVKEATARHFVDLDRPEAFRVIHAVVKVAQDAAAPLRARARALAEHVAERVSRASTADDFRREVDAVGDRGDLEILVEPLEPMAADGRIVDPEHGSFPPGQYVEPFARAASRLSEPGQKSGIVATQFGFHVLMLLEKTPPFQVPLEERRRRLRAEILGDRAKRGRDELVAELRSASPPLVERSAIGLTATLSLGLDDDEAR